MVTFVNGLTSFKPVGLCVAVVRTLGLVTRTVCPLSLMSLWFASSSSFLKDFQTRRFHDHLYLSNQR